MKKLCVVLAIVLVFGMAFVSCNNDTTSGGGERETVIFNGTNGNTTYTLTILPPGSRAALAGDDYVLVVNRSNSTKTSAGKVKEVNSNAFVLQPSVVNAPTFNVVTSSARITNISNTITFTDNTSEPGPGVISASGNSQSDNDQGEDDDDQGGNDHTHTWGAWAVTKPATCTEDGEETRICTKNDKHIDKRIIPALGHVWGPWVPKYETSVPEYIEEIRTCNRDPSHIEERTLVTPGNPPPGDGGDPGDGVTIASPQ